MIELDVFQQDNARQVMQKLRTFVKEGRIVLVTFDNELGPIGDLETSTKILGNTTDEKRWPAAGDLQDPGHHGTRCRLAVSAGHYN